jgi:hypothetical protein
MIDLQQNCHFVFSKCVDSRQKNSHIFILSCFSVLFALIFPVVKKKAPNKKQGTKQYTHKVSDCGFEDFFYKCQGCA